MNRAIVAEYRPGQCVLCRRQNRGEDLFSLPDYYLENQAGDHLVFDLHYRICRSCGLVYTDPQLSERSWLEFYKGSRNGANLSEARESIVARYDTYAMNMILPHLASGQKVLDVGAGAGSLLYYLQQKTGCTPVALEVSDPLADHIEGEYGFPVIRTRLEDAGLPDKSFDAICVIHVLEHLADPEAGLLALRHALKDDGILLAEVPSVFNPIRGITNIYSSHTVMFSPTTFACLAAKCGFSIVSRQDGPNITFLLRKATPGSLSCKGEYDKIQAFVRCFLKENLPLLDRMRQRLQALLRGWSSDGTDVLIWGAGEHTKLLFREYDFSGCRVQGVIDSDLKLRGTALGPYRVSTPALLALLPEAEVLISSKAFEEEIEKTILSLSPGRKVHKLYATET